MASSPPPLHPRLRPPGRSALAACFLLPWLAAGQTWVAQESGTTASLRGLMALGSRLAWAGGTGGTYLKTEDGEHWRAARVPGAEELDFRDVHALDGQTAWLLASGPGDRSRIYHTRDGGTHWTLQFTNPDAKGFLDAMGFRDSRHGIVVGDPVDGHFVVLTTDDGGEHWRRRTTPAAMPAEGAFAASGTCLAVRGAREAWFGTGGPGGARVFRTTDGGATWSVAQTPVRNDGPAAGIFSLAFSGALRGVAVGGDYTKPGESAGNIAITSDGGRTWVEVSGASVGQAFSLPAGTQGRPGVRRRDTATGHQTPPGGFRSAVAWVAGRKVWIAVGTSGSDFSADGGRSWKTFDNGAFNAVSVAPDGAGWAVGPGGRVAALRWR
jgi:photosystem II stability/assembly factor-like uncharacterized protein